MYILIIAIHAVFVTVAYLLGYSVLAGIFLILGIFFLFYFSPLFFLDEEKESKNNPSFSFQEMFFRFSPKESLLLPILLFYIALYGVTFALFGKNIDILLIHATITLSIYFIFVIYALFFYWKYDIFFDIFRFHTLFTLISTVFFAISSPFSDITYPILPPIIGTVGIIAGVFLLSYTKKENIIFLSSFLLALFGSMYLISVGVFPSIALLTLIFIGMTLAFCIFEFSPKIPLFQGATFFFQYFSLFTILLFLPLLLFIAYTTVASSSILLLGAVTLFFLSIHNRYTNYVVFILSIIHIYFIYSLIFSDLIVHPSISSLFLFIFFLPTLIVGTTYFWEERHQYDFTLLHYSSIIFSIGYSLYILFVLSWGGDLLFISSLCIFGVALLFFMSYFRFRITKPITY